MGPVPVRNCVTAGERDLLAVARAHVDVVERVGPLPVLRIELHHHVYWFSDE
jgi:hypothetical protein